MADDLTLTVKFEMTAYFLTLSYEVENRGARDAYLLNRLWRSAPRPDIDHNLIYVRFLAERSTVWLAKKIATIPTDRHVFAPVAPFATPLRAGGRFAEDVYIPLPLREHREYAPLESHSPPAPPVPSPPPSSPPRVFNQIYFSLDYYWAAKGIKERSLRVGNKPAILTWVPPGVQLEFGQLGSPLQYLKVPVAED